MITVLLVAIRPLAANDGPLYGLEVIDRSTGAVGTIIQSTFKLRDLVGDSPTSDLDVDGRRIRWTP
jgi:hypothetical protein